MYEQQAQMQAGYLAQQQGVQQQILTGNYISNIAYYPAMVYRNSVSHESYYYQPSPHGLVLQSPEPPKKTSTDKALGFLNQIAKMEQVVGQKLVSSETALVDVELSNF